MADLPPPNTKRWVVRRKAEVIAAVRGGLLSLDDACKRYNLTIDEFVAWQRLIERHGLPRSQGDEGPRLQKPTRGLTPRLTGSIEGGGFPKRGREGNRLS